MDWLILQIKADLVSLKRDIRPLIIAEGIITKLKEYDIRLPSDINSANNTIYLDWEYIAHRIEMEVSATSVWLYSENSFDKLITFSRDYPVEEIIKQVITVIDNNKNIFK
jgi:hypothetical protein